MGRRPAPQTAWIVLAKRKVRLGVMGFAELLILLGIPYAGHRAVALAEELMRFIAEEALLTSEQLAEARGVFGNWEYSIYARQGRRMRNATHRSIAPTGTIGILANASASIEPLFALAYRRRHVLGEHTLLELNHLFLQHARQQGFYSERLVQELQRYGSLATIPDGPPSTQDLFRAAWKSLRKMTCACRWPSRSTWTMPSQQLSASDGNARRHRRDLWPGLGMGAQGHYGDSLW